MCLSQVLSSLKVDRLKLSEQGPWALGNQTRVVHQPHRRQCMPAQRFLFTSQAVRKSMR